MSRVRGLQEMFVGFSRCSFFYGHLLNFEATPARDRQDRTGVAFIVESTCDFHWITGIDQPAGAFDDGTVDLVGAVPRRVLDDVPKFHDDQWVVHAAVSSLSSFSGFNKKIASKAVA